MQASLFHRSAFRLGELFCGAGGMALGVCRQAQQAVRQTPLTR